jgi:hypothetical protein
VDVQPVSDYLGGVFCGGGFAGDFNASVIQAAFRPPGYV